RAAGTTPAPPRARSLSATEHLQTRPSRRAPCNPSNPNVHLIPAESGNIAEGRSGARSILTKPSARNAPKTARMDSRMHRAGRARILDLGCGQGLLAAWLQAAAHCYERGIWPAAWPPAPRPQSMRGIEIMADEVARARLALGPDCDVLQADIRSAPFGSADAVVMLDVLHYLPAQSQREVLQRVRAALPPGGLLLLRVGDEGGGRHFWFPRWVDMLCTRLRG